MGGVGVEEAAAVRAEFLDDLLARNGPDRDRLLGSLERCRVDRAHKRLRHAEPHQRKGQHEGCRQEEVKRDPGNVDPEVADRLGGRAHETARERKGHSQARRGRKKVVRREAEHLGEITHRRLAAVVLPVRIGDETSRSVEGEVGRDSVEATRIQRQHVLQALQGVKGQEAGDGEENHRDRIAQPILLPRRVDARQAVKPAFNRANDRRQKRPVAREHSGDESAERHGARHNKGKRQCNLGPAGKCHLKDLGLRIFRVGSGYREGRGQAAQPPSAR